MTAVDTARRFAKVMETAAMAGHVRDRDVAARKVEWHLTNTPYWGGPPPTLEEAQDAARRAWDDDIPGDVAAALGMA